ncbi:hypothetical protein [Azospirillum sp. A1-3]
MHLLVTLPPTTALSEFVNALKTGTSRACGRSSRTR